MSIRLRDTHRIDRGHFSNGLNPTKVRSQLSRPRLADLPPRLTVQTGEELGMRDDFL